MEYEDDDQMDAQTAAAELRRLQQQYQQISAQEQQARQQAEQSRAARFKQAEEAIRQSRFGAPSRAEQLFAISQALLSPRSQPGFAGTLANVMPTFGQLAGAKNSAEQEREAMLQKLQQSYALQQEDTMLGGLGDQRKELLDMMRVYGPLAKPRAARTGFNPITGRLTNMDTAEPITPPPPRVGEVRDGYRYLGGDPAQQTSWQKV